MQKFLMSGFYQLQQIEKQSQHKYNQCAEYVGNFVTAGPK